MKNKVILKYLILSILFLGLALILGILGIVLYQESFSVIFLILSIPSLVTSLALVIVYLIENKALINRTIKDEEEILETLDKMAVSDVALTNISKSSEGLSKIASRVNDIAINGTFLKYQEMYLGDNFKEEISKCVRYGFIDEFSYIRLTNVYEDMLEEIKNKYPHYYIYKNKYYIDLVILDYGNKESLEKFFSEFVSNNELLKMVITYHPEIPLKNIYSLLDKKIKEKDQNIHIIHQEEENLKFVELVDKYRKADVSEEGLLDRYLKDMLTYLPFSNIGIKVDDDYLRVAHFEGEKTLDYDDEENYSFKKEYHLLSYKGKEVKVIFVNEEKVKIDERTKNQMETFVSTLDNIVIFNLGQDELRRQRSRYDRLEELSGNLSYEVDDDYIVKHASRKLSDRFNNKLVGHICYEVLYGREEACKDCPIKHGNSDTLLLGSNSFKRSHVKYSNRDVIFLLNKPKPYIPSKEELQNKLLGLINNDAKGYLLIFKIDALESLASKYKVDVEEMVKGIFSTLETYGLTNNLYRKEVDEFVYILEEGNVADATNVAKQVSRCFLEKFSANDKDISFIPKTLLLSYPLEVNTLFSLDSLCRSMFVKIDKKGRLYRIDEEPVAIDNHRSYMEMVEESYKDDNMPLVFKKVKDNKSNQDYEYVGINYVDQSTGLPIREDEITLYAKIDNTYLQLVERTVKNIRFADKTTYILPIGKEALDRKLFAAIQAYFNYKKLKLDRIIFEVKEKDIYNHLEEVGYIMNQGFSLAIDINDNNIYNLDTSNYRYLKLDGIKLEKDKTYQQKINSILNDERTLMIDDKHKDLLSNIRFTY